MSGIGIVIIGILLNAAGWCAIKSKEEKLAASLQANKERHEGRNHVRRPMQNKGS